MGVQVDQEKCIGAGQCVMAAPDVFDQRDEDGVVQVLDPDPAADQAGAVREAVALCPAAAIATSSPG